MTISGRAVPEVGHGAERVLLLSNEAALVGPLVIGGFD